MTSGYTEDMERFSIARRRLLNGILVACAATPLAASSRQTALSYEFSGPAQSRNLGLAPLLECTPGTTSQTQGPFYTPNTPRRDNLIEPDSDADPLILQGLVVTPDCKPVAGAVVDIWHCDHAGRYDNSGFRYRGHQFTDSAGSYRFMTIRPAIYPGRTQHIHVKVQGPDTRLLTTQIYFPDQKRENSRDWIFRSELLMDIRRTSDGWHGRFDFVLDPIG